MTEAPTHPAPSEWYCDRCGKTITDPNHSLVVWKMEDSGEEHGYLVIHKGRCDPGSKGDDGYTLSMDISVFLGDEGREYLLSMLSDGPFHLKVLKTKGGSDPRDLDEFVDLFRRMQTPYYEEARRHLNCPPVREGFSDSGTDGLYIPQYLREIANHEGECGWA